MSRVDIEALGRLSDAATPGPWGFHSVRVDGHGELIHDETPSASTLRYDVETEDFASHGFVFPEIWRTRKGWYYKIRPSHAALIVAMRNALPAILAELRAARALRAAIGDHQLAVVSGLDAVSVGTRIANAIVALDDATGGGK